MLMHEFRFQLFPLLLLVVLNFLQITYKNAHSVHYRTPPEVRHVNDSYRSPLDEGYFTQLLLRHIVDNCLTLRNYNKKIYRSIICIIFNHSHLYERKIRTLYQGV